jgi:hypothetical protein
MDRAPRVFLSYSHDSDRTLQRAGAEPSPRIDLGHLPAGAQHFLGRGPELAALDTAWAEAARTAVVELIAPGGTGKTALVKRWLDGLRPVGNKAGWGGAGLVFGWSFYSQGSGDDRQASEDLFLATAIERLGVEIAPSANPADKGQAIAERLCAGRTLLILDGCEPLQYPPGPMAGELRAPGLKTMLTQLAAAGQPGLCVVTSREWLADLAEWVRGDACPRRNRAAHRPRQLERRRRRRAAARRRRPTRRRGKHRPGRPGAARREPRGAGPCADPVPARALSRPRQGRRHPPPPRDRPRPRRPRPPRPCRARHRRLRGLARRRRPRPRAGGAAAARAVRPPGRRPSAGGAAGGAAHCRADRGAARPDCRRLGHDLGQSRGLRVDSA